MVYSKMWERIIESICILKIQYQVPITSQVLKGDFNANIITSKAGTVPDHVLLERRNKSYQGCKVAGAIFYVLCA